MLRFILRRLVSVLPTMFGVSVLIFLMIQLIPGDPALLILGERATESSLKAVRINMGLDKPIHVQYGKFMYKLVQGDLGDSFRSNEAVTKEIAVFLPATIELSLVAIIIASFVGMVAGVISATKQYSIFDYSSMVFSIMGISMPIFWLGLIFILIFSVHLGWLPISGRLSANVEVQLVTGFVLIDSLITKNWAAFRDGFWHILLPGFTLSTIPMALVARITRSSMLEVLRQDYIRTANAKGLSPLVVHYKHALRNALIPIVTVIGLSFGILMGGAVLTETVFAWPGMGLWILNGVYSRDYNVVQGGVLLIAFIFILVNTVVDILYEWINPRIRVN